MWRNVTNVWHRKQLNNGFSTNLWSFTHTCVNFIVRQLVWSTHERAQFISSDQRRHYEKWFYLECGFLKTYPQKTLLFNLKENINSILNDINMNISIQISSCTLNHFKYQILAYAIWINQFDCELFVTQFIHRNNIVCMSLERENTTISSHQKLFQSFRYQTQWLTSKLSS